MDLLTTINLILPKLGEHQVTALDTKHATLAIILPELDNEIKTLCLKGWWFNEFEYTAYPDTEKYITLGIDTLSFVPTDSNAAVLRNGKLYNPSTLSYAWPSSIKGNVTTLVPFNELPESAAQYALYSALINIYVTDIGIGQELQIWQTKAAEAYRSLLSEHLRQRRYSTAASPRFQRIRRAMRG